MGLVTTGIVVIFTLMMSIVLWNAGLIGSLRRYGEIGLRLAFGEDQGRLYRTMIAESLAIGLVGSAVGTLLGLVPAYWLQSRGFDVAQFMPNSSLMLSNVIRAHITATTFVIGFLPGVLATAIGTAISGAGVYKRQTASLMKELEA
jgi:putative ABC transport system permease protein